MRCTKTFLALAIAMPLPAVAQDWLPLSEGSTFKFEGRRGTLKFSTNRAGIPVVTAMGRSINKANSNIAFEQWYVTVAECQQGFGTLITTDLNGDVISQNQFVEGGGNVASTLAEMLCGAVKDREKRGL